MGLDVGIERERDQIRSGLPSPAPVTNIRLFRRDAVAVTSMAGMRLRNQFAKFVDKTGMGREKRDCTKSVTHLTNSHFNLCNPAR